MQKQIHYDVKEGKIENVLINVCESRPFCIESLSSANKNIGSKNIYLEKQIYEASDKREKYTVLRSFIIIIIKYSSYLS